jgi:hypothetical protein
MVKTDNILSCTCRSLLLLNCLKQPACCLHIVIAPWAHVSAKENVRLQLTLIQQREFICGLLFLSLAILGAGSCGLMFLYSWCRKVTLCIHPDKVHQKGANLQQKYIAEKVFDLLKVWLLLPCTIPDFFFNYLTRSIQFYPTLLGYFYYLNISDGWKGGVG